MKGSTGPTEAQAYEDVGMGPSGGQASASYGEHGLVFEDRAALRTWLSAQGDRGEGTWLVFGKPSTDQNDELDSLIRGHEPAYTNWSRMSPSVRKTYAKLYFDAKTEQTRARRLERILDRLDQNLKPM